MLKSFCESYIRYNQSVGKLNLSDYYTNYNKINGSFIISLPKDINKYNNSKKILGNLNFDPIKIEAVYGRDLKNTNIKNLFINLSYPEIGCFISHLITLYIISKHKKTDGYSIIFEDDIMIKDNKNINSKILNVTKYDANIVYLGKCLEMCSNITQIDKLEFDVFYGYKPLCLHAYMIKNSFAKTIIDYIGIQKIINLPIDKLILDVANKKNDIIVFHPSLFYQNVNYDSNLRGKFAQQFNIMDCRITNSVNNYIISIIICILILGIITTLHYIK
jgi:GR25 family glycosyltransferase involved in LPS biosynthesis